ncbi:MAG: hypothetical protein ACP5NS_04250 [Candidatus Pacearchaeota archaeon]
MSTNLSNGHKFLFVLAILILIISIFSLGLIYLSANTLFSQISGRVTTGETNLTVETLNEVNFTTRAISWGSGRVNQDVTAASLTTSNHSGIANVTGGNWTLTTTGGMRIENLGNSNVTINFTVSKNVSEFIGGTNAVFQWNLTALEANSCLNVSRTNGGVGGLQVNNYYDANSTPVGRIGCTVFPSEGAKDTLRLDFNLTIPENSLTGSLGNIITAVVTSI